EGSIAQIARGIVQCAGVLSEHRGDHELGDGVLGATQMHVTVQWHTALDHILHMPSALPHLGHVLQLALLHSRPLPCYQHAGCSALASAPSWLMHDLSRPAPTLREAALGLTISRRRAPPCGTAAAPAYRKRVGDAGGGGRWHSPRHAVRASAAARY